MTMCLLFMHMTFLLQLFSHSCSDGLRFMVECGKLTKNALTTAWFLKTINNWFDCMSSRHGLTALYTGSTNKLNLLCDVRYY